MTKIATLLIVTALSAPALAQPGATPPVTLQAPAETPDFVLPEDVAYPNRGYLAGNLALGGYAGRILVGISLEGSKRLGDHLYVHGQGTAASADDIALFGPALQGAYQDLRIGMESRACTLRRGACVYAGVDAGIVHTSLQREESMPSDSALHGAVVPRAGFELGQNVRLRVGIEVPATTDGTAMILTSGLGVAL